MKLEYTSIEIKLKQRLHA